MKKQQQIKISLIVNKSIHVYIYVTRDEYNRCYNCPSCDTFPCEYCVQIPLTIYAYKPLLNEKNRRLHFAKKDIGKDFYNYLMNKYCPTI